MGHEIIESGYAGWKEGREGGKEEGKREVREGVWILTTMRPPGFYAGSDVTQVKVWKHPTLTPV